MRLLYQHNSRTHSFHAYFPGADVALCGVPRNGSRPSAESIEIPLEIRCVFCEAVRKQERLRLGLDPEEPLVFDEEADDPLLDEVAEKYH